MCMYIHACNIIEQVTLHYGVLHGTIDFRATPSLRECQTLYGQQWLTDEVFTSDHVYVHYADVPVM